MYPHHRPPSPSKRTIHRNERFLKRVLKKKRADADESRDEIRRHAPDQLAQKDFLVRVERLRIESNKISVSHSSSELLSFHVASPSSPRIFRSSVETAAVHRQIRAKKTHRIKHPTHDARSRDVASNATSRRKTHSLFCTYVDNQRQELVNLRLERERFRVLAHLCFTHFALLATPFDATVGASGSCFWAFQRSEYVGCFTSKHSSSVCFFETSFDSVRCIPIDGSLAF